MSKRDGIYTVKVIIAGNNNDEKPTLILNFSNYDAAYVFRQAARRVGGVRRVEGPAHFPIALYHDPEPALKTLLTLA